jgi:hypothetical protein
MESENTDLVFLRNIFQVCPEAGRQQSQTYSSLYVQLASKVKKFADDLKSSGFDSKKFFGQTDWTPSTMSQAFDSLHSYYFYSSKLLDNVSPKEYKKLKQISTMYKIIKNFPTEELN